VRRLYMTAVTISIVVGLAGYAKSTLTEAGKLNLPSLPSLTEAQHARCHNGGVGLKAHPDNRCTPGHYLSISLDQACTHRDRPDLDSNVRKRILRDYGVPSWTGRNGELDHRVPFFLGGTTDRRNIWPEEGPLPNTKDRLESTAGTRSIYYRVCHAHTMTLGQARLVFLRDWRVGFHRYVE
jgi:hypothetical protein